MSEETDASRIGSVGSYVCFFGRPILLSFRLALLASYSSRRVMRIFPAKHQHPTPNVRSPPAHPRRGGQCFSKTVERSCSVTVGFSKRAPWIITVAVTDHDPFSFFFTFSHGTSSSASFQLAASIVCANGVDAEHAKTKIAISVRVIATSLSCFTAKYAAGASIQAAAAK
jgi:hypothetical protein